MDYQITGSKLLSQKNCLSVLFYNLRIVKFNLHESTTLVVDECLIFWKKAHIPTQNSSNIIKKSKKLYEDLKTLEKIKTTKSDLCRKRERYFEDK